MEVDFYALERAYSLFAAQLSVDHVEKYVALIDFNPYSIVFLVMYRKNAIFQTRQVYSGDVLVPMVQRAMKLEVSTAKIKPVTLSPISVASGVNAENEINQLNSDHKTHLLMTIRRLFQSFYSENPGKVIDQVALSGRCALLSDIHQHLEKSLEIPVKVVNPIASLKVGKRVDKRYAQKIGPALTLSCGLALRGIPLWK